MILVAIVQDIVVILADGEECLKDSTCSSHDIDSFFAFSR